MRSRRVGLTVLLAVLVAGGLVGAACGGSSNNATATPKKTAQPAATSTKAAGTTTAPQATSTKAATSATTAAAGTPAVFQVSSVKIQDYQFTPDTVTLVAGSTVIWLNSGPSTHTVTADDGSFDSGNLSQGKTYSHTFDTAGTYAYHCSIHPTMKAQVVIEATTGSSPSNPIQ